MRLHSKREFAEWLYERYELAVSEETRDLIVLIGDVYLDKASDRELSDKEKEAVFFNAMRGVYSSFCFNVLETAPQYDASDAKALKEIIRFLRAMIEGSNKRNNRYESPAMVDSRVLTAWQMILSKEFWFTLPENIRNWSRIRQIAPKMSAIMNMLRSKMKDSHVAAELKKRQDEAALRTLLQAGNGI